MGAFGPLQPKTSGSSRLSLASIVSFDGELSHHFCEGPDNVFQSSGEEHNTTGSATPIDPLMAFKNRKDNWSVPSRPNRNRIGFPVLDERRGSYDDTGHRFDGRHHPPKHIPTSYLGRERSEDSGQGEEGSYVEDCMSSSVDSPTSEPGNGAKTSRGDSGTGQEEVTQPRDKKHGTTIQNPEPCDKESRCGSHDSTDQTYSDDEVYDKLEDEDKPGNGKKNLEKLLGIESLEMRAGQTPRVPPKKRGDSKLDAPLLTERTDTLVENERLPSPVQSPEEAISERKGNSPRRARKYPAVPALRRPSLINVEPKLRRRVSMENPLYDVPPSCERCSVKCDCPDYVCSHGRIEPIIPEGENCENVHASAQFTKDDDLIYDLPNPTVELELEILQRQQQFFMDELQKQGGPFVGRLINQYLAYLAY